MKFSTKLIITFMIMILMPVILAVGSYLVLKYAFGFYILERVVENGQEMIKMSEESLVSSLIILVCIDVLTAIALSNWIRYGIFKPVEQLKKAIALIKQGDYDTRLLQPPKGEFEELFNDFDMMRINLKESREERFQTEKQNRELIANISHDLKTPITSIRGYVEGIMDGVADTDEKMDHYIKTIYNKANALNTLINELTVYTKIDARQITYDFQKIPVREYFDDCAAEMLFDLQEQGISLKYENKSVETGAILADPEQISKVLHNIFSNSVKYKGYKNPYIRLTVRDIEDGIQVDVRDNGIGISPDDTLKIFDRFYRSDASRNSDKGGSGIGLSIAKQIIEDHGGKIWATVDSNPGLALHFTLRQYTELRKELQEETTRLN